MYYYEHILSKWYSENNVMLYGLTENNIIGDQSYLFGQL